MTAALPAFFAGHQLVEFHREDTEGELHDARRALSPRLEAIQEAFDAMNSSGGDYVTDDVVVAKDSTTADGVTSWDQTVDPHPTEGMYHRPVLDIDFGAALIPSSTEGHFHLYLDKLMTWEKYSYLLQVLAEVGIIEPGYNEASQNRGYSAARLPWVTK